MHGLAGVDLVVGILEVEAVVGVVDIEGREYVGEQGFPLEPPQIYAARALTEPLHDGDGLVVARIAAAEVDVVHRRVASVRAGLQETVLQFEVARVYRHVVDIDIAVGEDNQTLLLTRERLPGEQFVHLGRYGAVEQFFRPALVEVGLHDVVGGEVGLCDAPFAHKSDMEVVGREPPPHLLHGPFLLGDIVVGEGEVDQEKKTEAVFGQFLTTNVGDLDEAGLHIAAAIDVRRAFLGDFDVYACGVRQLAVGQSVGHTHFEADGLVVFGEDGRVDLDIVAFRFRSGTAVETETGYAVAGRAKHEQRQEKQEKGETRVGIVVHAGGILRSVR